MKRSAVFALVLSALFLLSSSVFSATIYVKWDSPGPAFDGNSWDTAFHKIQDGINKATVGDEVWVAGGMYVEKVVMKDGVALKGGYAGEESTRDVSLYETTIDANSTWYDDAVVTGANNAVIDGFTICNATYGIHCFWTSPTISNNTIKDCGSYGVYVGSASSPTITGNTILRNGYGIYSPVTSSSTGGTPIITGNTIAGNRSDGIYSATKNAVIDRNIVIGNMQSGIKGFGYDQQTVTNNIIASNGGGIYCGSDSRMTITGNTVVRNYSSGLYCSSSTPLVSNNIIAFNSKGIGNNPGFGTTAPVLSRNDIYGNEANYVPDSLSHPSDISVDPLFASLECGNLHIRSTSPCRNTGDRTAPGVTSLDVDEQARVQGTNVDIGADESYEEAYPSPYPRLTLYVDATAADGGDGKSWASAFKTVQAAFDSTLKNGGSDVWVAKGRYRECVTVFPFCNLYGGFVSGNDWTARNPRANHTIIEGTKERVSSVTTACHSTLDGFTIQGLHIGVSAVATSRVQNCIITDNMMYGVYCGNETVVACNNIAANGSSGVFCRDRASVINNTIVANGNYGVYSDSTHENAAPLVTNNIIAFNKQGVGCHPESWIGVPPVLSRNDVYGNETNYLPSTIQHTADFSADPGLASLTYGNLHVRPYSICRNAGNTAVAGLPQFDIDGQPRLYQGTVDVGADESHLETYPDPYPARILRVYSDAAPGGDGTAWHKAYNKIQSAVDDTLTKGGAEILVTEGTYTENIKLRPFSYLYGGIDYLGTKENSRDPAKKPTVIDGGHPWYHHSVVSGSQMSTVDGFILQGAVYGVECKYQSPVISNNVFRNNSGGIDCYYSSPTITGNRIEGSGATGIGCTYSSPIISSNLIKGWDWGIYCSSGAPIIANNTIVGNKKYNSSGIHTSSQDYPTITNNIVTSFDKGISNGNSSYYLPGLTCNNSWENTTNYYRLQPDLSNISVDPQFIDPASGDYHLAPGSPCIDTGNPVNAPITDLDEAPRPRDGNGDGGALPDIGCYECPDNYMSIANVKTLEDGIPVGITACISATDYYGNLFYLEPQSRACGIGVQGQSLFLGRYATVEGVTSTVNGERVITPTLITFGGAAPEIKPLYIDPSNIGGGTSGMQEGVAGGRGLNNIGLLVKTVGRIGEKWAGGFYLNGIKVNWQFMGSVPGTGTLVEMIAVSSCTENNGKIEPMLRHAGYFNMRAIEH